MMVKDKSLKPGWRTVKFGDVARQVKDKADPEASGLERYVAGDHMDTNELRIRRWGEIGSGYLGPAFHIRFQPGQVLYGSRRTYLRKVAVANFTGICANTTFVIETRSASELLPEYLPFVMQTETFHAHSIKQSKGSVNPYINFTDLNWFEFDLPPIKEQQKIADNLAAADDLVASIEHAKGKHGQLLESFIQGAFERFDNNCKHRPSAELMGKITVGIVVKPADLYVEAGAGVLALRSLNVFPGRFVLNETVEISPHGHTTHEKSALSAGDIVVVRTGRPGDAAVIPPELDGTNCIDLIVAKPGPEVDAQYVVTFLNSQFGRRLFSSGTTGTAQQHFNVGEFSKLKLPVPPLPMQRQFVSDLNDLRGPGDSLGMRLTHARQVRSLLLNELVGGH
jgi:type I restriction enzyme S subunit